MYARVSKFQVPSDQIARDIDQSKELVGQLDESDGFEGAYYLVDRSSGQTMAVTLWRDEQALRDSEASANRIREQGTQEIEGSEIVSVDRYEVVIQPKVAVTR